MGKKSKSKKNKTISFNKKLEIEADKEAKELTELYKHIFRKKIIKKEKKKKKINKDHFGIIKIDDKPKRKEEVLIEQNKHKGI